MKFKKTFLLLVTIPLVACGGGSSGASIIGDPTDQSSFANAAAVFESKECTYTKAHLSFKHYQKSADAGTGSMNCYANYSGTRGSWTLGDNNLPSGITAYQNFINLTMSQYSTVMNTIETIMTNPKSEFFKNDFGGSFKISGHVNYQSNVGRIEAFASWNEMGLMVSYHELNVWDTYSGYSNVTVEETMTFTYSA